MCKSRSKRNKDYTTTACTGYILQRFRSLFRYKYILLFRNVTRPVFMRRSPLPPVFFSLNVADGYIFSFRNGREDRVNRQQYDENP